MASPSNKKLLILYVLQVLRDYSSEAHPMRRQDIANKIEAVYGMPSERKAISTNLNALQDFGFDIVEINGKGVYLRSEFSAGELRLLGDYVLGSKYIPKEFARELAGKLRGLGNGAPSTQEIMPSRYPTSPDLFSSIEIFRKAIQSKKRVSFICNTFTRDKRMHPVSSTLMNWSATTGAIICSARTTNSSIISRWICSLRRNAPTCRGRTAHPSPISWSTSRATLHRILP